MANGQNKTTINSYTNNGVSDIILQYGLNLICWCYVNLTVGFEFKFTGALENMGYKFHVESTPNCN